MTAKLLHKKIQLQTWFLVCLVNKFLQLSKWIVRPAKYISISCFFQMWVHTFINAFVDCPDFILISEIGPISAKNIRLCRTSTISHINALHSAAALLLNTNRWLWFTHSRCYTTNPTILTILCKSNISLDATFLKLVMKYVSSVACRYRPAIGIGWYWRVYYRYCIGSENFVLR